MAHVIREARVTDLPFLLSSLPTFRQELSHCVIERDAPSATGLQIATAKILPLDETTANSLCLVTEIDDHIEGILTLRGSRYEGSQHVSFLDLLFLNPKWRRQGIGLAMLTQAIEWACRADSVIERLQTTVPTANVGVARLLMRVGFQSEGLLKNYTRLEDGLADVHVFALLLAKKLASR